MSGFIPYGRQAISEADIAAVTSVLRSDYLTQGPVVPRFEAAVAARVGAAHGVALNSATSALHVACMALGLGPGDALWTVPTTFVASANCGLYCGASVDFVDIDRATWLMCPRALAGKLKLAKASGRLPKVLVPVHLQGEPCDMAAIGALAREYGVRVIEDASHAIGAQHAGHAVGSCAHSDITVFSFHPVKIVTTAEGGLATTNDPALARRMELARSHGITRDPAEMTRAPDGPWYYEQIALGYNYRMTEMQAALGLSQLDRLGAFIDRRQALAARYDRLLKGLPVTLPRRASQNRSALHLYVVRVPAERHRATFDAMRTAGIGVNLHYIPVHLQPHYRAMGFAPGDFPQAEAYSEQAISLPLFPGLSEDEQDRVVATLAQALAA
ncbi:MAG: UDP-4-amino-4,6-dideoxy-N-acetyl-beta-L-altrosamine transaminase [Rhodobacteraceae bacterium HLUCCA12]|nr:MAG: UDP-4-amino-4,6-dideoxy-N-acetyl-beta-L-altrosamine transaminase [Rhodobacteraceae bacterium HLUCCA12]